MPFILYEVIADGDQSIFDLQRQVALGGKKGPLRAVHDRKNPGRVTQFPWHCSEQELLLMLDADPSCSAVLIDLKPGVNGNVSLYRIRSVWGFSHVGWTPIAVLLESMFSDRREADPAAFKRRFTVEDMDRDLVGEFLYLQGGAKTGNWTWGKAGLVNGALLWPEAFEYLTKSLGSALAKTPS